MTSSKYKYINFIIEPHKFNSLENMQNLKRKFLAMIQNTKFQLHVALTKNNIIMFSNQFVKVVMRGKVYGIHLHLPYVYQQTFCQDQSK